MNSTKQFRYLELLSIIVISTFFSGCKLAQTLYYEKVNDRIEIDYSLHYNNRSKNHKPIALYISVDTLYSKTRNHRLYIFYLNSNTVEKFHGTIGIKENYILLKELRSDISSEEIVPISELEAGIFNKVIFLSDSLRLKNFNYLKESRGFIVSSKKFEYYLRSR